MRKKVSEIEIRAFFLENPIALQVCRDSYAHVYLHLAHASGRVVLLGMIQDKESSTGVTDESLRDILKFTVEDYKRYFKPLGTSPDQLAHIWLTSPIPLTERAKEILMVINIDRRTAGEVKYLGKYNDLEEGVKSAEVGTEVAKVPEELNQFSTPILTQIYNAIVGPEKKVKGFSNKTLAMDRVTKAIFDLPVSETLVSNKVPTEIPAPQILAESKIPAEPKAVKAPTKELVKPLKLNKIVSIPLSTKIHILAPKNPHREGTGLYVRWDLYSDGMTIGEALKAGITRADLPWMAEHKYIEFEVIAAIAEQSEQEINNVEGVETIAE